MDMELENTSTIEEQYEEKYREILELRRQADMERSQLFFAYQESQRVNSRKLNILQNQARAAKREIQAAQVDSADAIIIEIEKRVSREFRRVKENKTWR